MKKYERGYQTPLIDNTMGQGRSVTIELPNEVWRDLDKIGRHRNTSKRKLVLPLIEEFVRREIITVPFYDHKTHNVSSKVRGHVSA